MKATVLALLGLLAAELVTVRDPVAQALRDGKSADDIRASKPTADFEQRVGGPPNFITQFVDGLITELGAQRRLS